MENLISITPQEPDFREEKLISITDSYEALGDELATRRAQKAHYGLGEESGGVEEFRQNLISGREKETREHYARMLASRKLRQRYQDITRRAQALQGSGLTPDEIDFYSTMSAEQIEEPFSAFESGYANEYINNLNKFAENDPYNILAQAFGPPGSIIDRAILDQVPSKDIQALRDSGKDFMRKRGLAQTRLEDAEEAFKKQSALGTAADIGKHLLPLYAALKTKEGLFPFLSGANLDEQIAKYYQDSSGEAEKLFNENMDKLIKDNPLLAMYYASAYNHRTSLESFLDDAFDIFDVSTLGWGLTKPIVMQKVLKKAVRDAITQDIKDADEARMAADMGASETSAVEKVTREVQKDLSLSKDPLKQFEEFNPETSMPSIYGGRGTFNLGSFKADREALQRLRDKVLTSRAVFNRLLTLGGPERLTKEQVQTAVHSEWDRLKGRYPNLDDTLIDYDIVHSADKVNYGVFYIGKNDGTLFKNIREAQNSAKFYGLDDILDAEIMVKTKGGKAYIQVVRALKETDDAVRDAAITLNKIKTPEGLFPSYLRMLRSSEYTLSDWNLANRKAATYAPNMYWEYLKIVTDDLRKVHGFLRKDEEQALTKIWKHNNLMDDPTNPERRGYFYKTVGELEDAYMSIVGRKASEREIHAYFAYTDLYDMDSFFRQLAVHRHQSLLGMESVRLRYKLSGQDQEVTDFFAGRYVDNLPARGSHEATIYLRDSRGKDGVFRSLNSMTDGQWKDLQDKILNQGYRVIETYSPIDPKVKNITGKTHDINFIVTNGSESKRLPWKKFEHRGGGHVVNEYEAWLKVPRVKRETIGTGRGRRFRSVYQGDTPLMPFTTMEQGRVWAGKLNAVLDLIWARKFNEARKLADATLPAQLEYKEIVKWTKDGTIPEGEHIRVLESHKSVMETEPGFKDKHPNLVDDTKSPYNHAQNANIGFLGERDAPIWTILEKGGTANWVPAKTLDPMPTLNRAMNKLITSRAVDDYRMLSVENWISEFGDLLKGGAEQARRNPFWYFYHGEPISGSPETHGRIQAMLTSREQVKQLLGTRSDLGVSMHRISQKLSDTVYKKLGQEASEIFDIHVLPKIKDPASYIRSFTFHSKLGLFNWVQLFVQMQTLHHILALSPTNATQAMAATFAARMLGFTENEKIIRTVGRKMRAFGWDEDSFLEAHRLLKETGFHVVGGEVAFLDDIAAPKLFDTGGRKVLNAGTSFFREGERAVRVAAWFTAFREYRKTNPGKVIDALDRNQLLQRADFLSLNMSRASNSLLQQGLPSLSVQFLTYQTRLIEQFVGKLSWEERARVFGIYGLLYGFPLAISGVTGVPVYDAIRSEALNRGIDVHDPAVHQLLEGLYSTVIKLISGKETNFAQRFAPQGFTNITQFLRGDLAWWELVGGAGASTIGDLIKSMDPLSHALASIARDGGESFPIAPEDLVDILKNWSSASNTVRTLIGVNTGKFVSRRDLPLTEVTSIEALLLGAFGLAPLGVTDAFLKAMSSKEYNQFYNEEGQEIIRDIQRALRMGNDDPEAAREYLKRATKRYTLTGMPPHVISRLLHRAIQGEYLDFAEGINWPWLRSLPQDKQPAVLQQYEREQERKRLGR